MAKQSLIKWKEEDKKNLEKAISDFNKKINKLKKTRKDISYLPEELDYERTMKEGLITTRKELNKVLESLSKAKSKDAFKKVTLPSGDSLTNWELEQIKSQQKVAKTRIKKRMRQIEAEHPEFFSNISEGNQEYIQLKSILESIEQFGLKKKSPKITQKRHSEILEETKSRIANWGSSDFEMRRAIIYRENYFKMLKEKYSSLPNYKEVKAELEKIQNPLVFYERLKGFEEGEKLKDISFMYDNVPYQENLNKIAESLGLKTVEVSEEGE